MQMGQDVTLQLGKYSRKTTVVIPGRGRGNIWKVNIGRCKAEGGDITPNLQ